MAMYMASCAPAAQTVSTDLEIIEAGTGIIVIYELYIWQTSDVGDAQEEILSIQWITAYTTSGSGGQTTVVAPNNSFDAASTAVVELFNTTLATVGTPIVRYIGGWNVRAPYEKIWQPETRPVLRNGERGVFRLPAPADALTIGACIVFEQL